MTKQRNLWLGVNEMLRCHACQRQSDEHAEGWTAFLKNDLDEFEAVGVSVFCPDCAATHFGWIARQPLTPFPDDEPCA